MSNTESALAEPLAENPVPATAAQPPSPEFFYAEGEAFLYGTGRPRDEGQAIANFLNASDLGHAGGAFKAALMYFTGAGITRNVDEAVAQAKLCLERGSSVAIAQACQDLVDGSLGTFNAQQLLAKDEEGIVQMVDGIAKRQKYLLLAGAAVGLLVLGGALTWFLARQHQDDLPSLAASELARIVSPAEASQARSEALASIARLKADAAQSQDDGAAPRAKDF